MLKQNAWLVIAIVVACTCGVRPECNTGRIQIGFLTSIHDDPACREISPKGVLMYEAANYLATAHNEKSKGFDIEIIVQDTCGTITGSLRAAMKAMVMADINCLQPPNLLGLIGPDSLANAEAVNKVTSVLKVPLLVKKTNNAPFMHYLAKESDTYIIKGVIRLLETLKWKSFTLVTNDLDNEDDVQNIAKKLTMEAIAKNMCVMIYDEDSEYSSRIVHIGIPKVDFFNEPSNATIIVVSEGNLEEHLNLVDSSNNILLLEDSRNEFAELEERVEKSKLWAEGGNQKYDAEELREVRWLENAVHSYSKALETTCKKKKCKNQLNPSDWNNALSTVVEGENAKIRSATRMLDLMLKMKGSSLQEMGNMMVVKNQPKVIWKGETVPSDEEEFNEYEEDMTVMPDKLKKLISKDKSVGSGCATATGSRVVEDDDEDDDAKPPIFVSEMDDADWWTMVATVSGVGVAMFVVGILAVYVLMSNIRGPRQNKIISRFSRGSFRRGSVQGDIPATVRSPRPQQRNDSIRSVISENGV